MLPLVRRWLTERTLRQRARAYVDTLLQEPDDADVKWLAALSPTGDVDHARWELRYARRVLGLQVASRDALDDRTASVVAEALTSAVRRDDHVAPDKLPVVERQLNARLRGYADALGQRGGEPTAARLARTLLSFTGVRDGSDPAVAARAGELLARYLGEANDALRAAFGAAALPEDAVPSSLAPGARG